MSRRRVALVGIGAALALLFGGRWVAIQYTEAAWYADLGRSAMFWSRLVHQGLWQLAVAGLAVLWYGAHLFAVYRSIGAVHLPRRVGNLEIAEAVPRRILRWIALALAVLLGVVTAATFTDLPTLVSLYRSAVPLGIREPVLGRDAAFYLARLPLLETLHLAALALVLFGGFVTAALYAMTGSITLSGRRLRMTPQARAHLVVLLALLAVVVAWGFHLDTYAIVGGGGADGGALTAVDRAIRLPASTALSALALVVAAGTVATLWRGHPRLLGAMWATLAAAGLLGRFVAPYVVQAWAGPPTPPVAAALAQYADRYSRAGLGVLRGLEREPLASTPDAPRDSLAAMAAALAGVSPWAGAPRLLQAALDAVVPDSGRPRLWTTTLDRYDGPGGRPVLAVLAVPEPDQLGLAREPRPPDWTLVHRGPLSWAGPPVAVAAGLSASGALHFFASLSPVGDSGLVPRALAGAPGRIRYVAYAAGPAIAGPAEPPPAGGPAGLVLGGPLRRLLLAWALQSPALLGGATSVADRLVLWRDVPRRLARLYPFATFDRPRAVLADGRLVWLADGLLASDRFPLAAHVAWQDEQVNFLRAAYVATVDAVSGATRLYLRPPGSPFAARIAAAMDARALPAESLDAALRRHLDYPPDLLVAQAEMLALHRGDTGAAARPWALAPRLPVPAAPLSPDTARPAPPRPTPALLALGQPPVRLWSLLPLTDETGGALVAFLAATVHADGAPSLRLLRLGPRPFPTPASAASRISLSPTLAGAMASLSGPEGRVRRGDAMAVPAGGTVAYLQYLFASPDSGGAPLLPRGVAVLVGGRVGVGASVAEALRAARAGGGGSIAAERSSASLAEARAAFLSLDSAVRARDWAKFGRAYEALRRALGAPPSPGRRP